MTSRYANHEILRFNSPFPFFRPERFNMRLYSLDKRNFLLVFMAFFACFSLGIFIGLAGWIIFYFPSEFHLWVDFIKFSRPEITLTREIDASTLSNSSQEEFLANGPFVIQTRLLGSYSRQFWLFAKYQIENTESELCNLAIWYLHVKFQWTIKSYLYVYTPDEIFDTTFQVNVIIKGLDDSKLVVLDEYSSINRTRHLKCKGNTCEDFTIMHLAWLEYSHYQLNVNFFGLNHKRYNINKLYFYVRTW